VMIINAFTGLATLLIPIYAYTEGAGLQGVIVLGIIGVAPDVFGSLLGGLADKFRSRLLPGGVLVVGFCLASLGFVQYSIKLLIIVLAFRIVLVLLGLVAEIEVTARISSDRYGRVSAVFEGLKDLGKVAGTVLLGFSMDWLGASVVFKIVGLLTCALGAFLFLKSKQFLQFPVDDIPSDSASKEASEANAAPL
jgi:predicted MFS family arabinose efflux permease